jgi:uncharacterized protein (DUF427 family)
MFMSGSLVEPTPRWVRVRFGGRLIADSRRALLLCQYGGRDQLPSYYFPREDVLMESLIPVLNGRAAPEVTRYSVKVGDRVAANAAWMVTAPPASHAALGGHVSFDWARMDAWYEEEEEVFVHARDPHKRIDVLRSSRHVRVVVHGEPIADTRRPHLLFETGLPTRYYIPREDVKLERLEPTGLHTRCPYKGIASYWNVRAAGSVSRNLVWSYPEPIPECPAIKGLLCFFDEHADVYVDGQLQPRPQTPWSSVRL